MKRLDLTNQDVAGFLQDNFGKVEAVVVPRTRTMPYKNCYGNVRQVVRTDGGFPQWGWALSEVPGRFLEAQHHAVWMNPAGQLEDVTDGVTKWTLADKIFFVPDNSVPPSATDPCLPSRFKQLDSSNTIKKWIDGNIKRMEMLGQVKAMASTVPHDVLPDGGMRFRGQPPAAIMLLIKAVDRLQQELMTLDRKITSSN